MPWTTVTPSAFPWEQEALGFVRQQLPPSTNIHVWSNFEFVADSGSIYEVDMLCVSPWGAFLVEIKSRPGVISGMGNLWSWHHEGKSKTAENPLLLANRKCKALASLLERQKAFKNERIPFIEPLVFCSATSNNIQLGDPQRVCNRSKIIAAITKRGCPGLKLFHQPPINTPALRAFLQAVEQSGIDRKPVQKTKRAGDYKLDELFHDSPTGAYQDWIGSHATSKSGLKLIRIYLEHQQATEADRQTVRRASEREYQILNRLDNPGILRAETLTPTDIGHALVFRLEAPCVRLDQFLAEQGETLGLLERINLLRQIAEAVAYAHGKKVVHRALSPQSILVITDDKTGKPRPLLYNFQVSLARSDTHPTGQTRVSRTLHADQLIEDISTVYLAPEMVSGSEMEGEELDAFSLGAIAYHLFSKQPPAAKALELVDVLNSSGGALDLRAVVNGIPDGLADLVKFSANADRGLRYDAKEFLAQLDKVEEDLTAPDQAPVVDPREAGLGDELLHGLKVKRKLGTGSTSIVLQVEDAGGQVRVLKLASKPEHNGRLRQEFDLLRRVRHSNIVAVYDFLEFGEIHGFTMDRAGDETLAQRLRKDGRLEIELLERFGDDLLQTIDCLDKDGISHRDIKPDNLGVRSAAKGPLRLIIFDFSLSTSAPEDIRLGTPPYLDPFLSLRKVKRWDAYAERYAAAVTLYEMATGALPRWGGGDGKSAPHLVQDEATLDPELFPAPLRGGLTAFFQRALKREFKERYDNAELMRSAWRDIFRHVGEPAVRPAVAGGSEPATSRADILSTASLDTQLILLGLSTRRVNVLDRLELVTVADLLRHPLIKIQRMRGVGNKTRKELADLVIELRRHFPGQRPGEKEQVEEAAEAEAGLDDSSASIDMLAKFILGSGRSLPAKEKEILLAFLGQEAVLDDPRGMGWPSQSDLAPGLDISRARVGQVVTKARARWAKTSSITHLRQTATEVLAAKGGVVTHEEFISSLLNLRGSALPDPERTRMASMVARVAIEAERHLQKPRFEELRRRGRIFIALAQELVDFAQSLGRIADELADEEPLPTSASTFQRLQSLPFPQLDLPGLVTPDPSRLVHLAAATSDHACANARLELYPRGLEAARALKLAQNALFGSRELTVEELRERVMSRYREAQPLPDRPELDDLLASVGLSLRWSPEARNGLGAYVPNQFGGASDSEGMSSLQRTQTRNAPLPRKQVSEEMAEAMRLEEKLRYAERQGSFLVLAAPPRHLQKTVQEIVRRFAVTCLDGDALFLAAMKAEAHILNVDWKTILMADSGSEPRDWERLQLLVSHIVPGIKTALRDSRQTILLTNPGLFVRYHQLDLFQEIRASVGTPQGPHGLWMVIPSHGPGTQPRLNDKAIPITNPAQFEILNETWIANEHPHPPS